jgi:RecT family
MTTTHALRPFSDRYARMESATVELIAESSEHRRYRVTARQGHPHDVVAILTATGCAAVSCDCEAFRFYGDPELCVHCAKLTQHIEENEMNTELARANGNGVATLPQTTDQLRAQNAAFRDIIRSSYARGASDDVLDFVAGYCQATGLNLFAGHVNVIKRRAKNSRGEFEDTWQISPSIHGLLHIADRTGTFDGISDEEWCDADGEWHDIWIDGSTPPTAARCKVWRKGMTRPSEGKVTWQGSAQYTDEWENGRKTGKKMLNERWEKAGAEQLMKCAQSQGLKKAFPQSEGAPGTWRQPLPAGAEYVTEEHIVYGDAAQEHHEQNQAIAGEYREPDMPEPQAGNSVQDEFNATKKRILAKSKALPTELWNDYFKVNVRKWAEHSLKDLEGIEAWVNDQVSRLAEVEPADDPFASELPDEFANG